MTREWRNIRERVLELPGVPARLRSSANSAYWQGRLLRLYLLSVVWNAQHGRAIILAGRLFHAVDTLLLARGRLFSADFRRALRQPHMTQGFEPDPSALDPRPRPA